MGGKRNKRKISDGSANNGQENKTGRFTGSPVGVSVSNILSEANSILYDDHGSDDSHVVETSDQDSGGGNAIEVGQDSSVLSTPPTSASMNTGDQRLCDPTNADILRCLKAIEAKIGTMDKRLQKLESLEQKVDNFEVEMKKLWTYAHDQNRKMDERMNKVEEKVESTDYAVGLLSDRVVQADANRKSLEDEVVYLQSQSMRSNLVFGGIPEADPQEDTERVLRDFLVDKMRIAQETVESMQFDRVHRMGPRQSTGSKRKVVARFSVFKEREFVRKQWKTLKGTDYFVHEQFPKEVNDRRRKLVPLLKDARKANKRAWLAYDTLYVDGKPVNADS